MAVGVDVSRQNGVGRRAWLQGGLALGAAALAGWPGREVLAAHGMAWGGEPRYPESFAHFDYVRPDAPRGGLVRLAGMGTFDSLNPFLVNRLPAHVQQEAAWRADNSWLGRWLRRAGTATR